MERQSAADAVAQMVVQQEVVGLVLESWAEVDHNLGADIGPFFTEDAVLDLGPTKYEGRDGIVAFFVARRQRGPRVSRHVLTNVRVKRRPDSRVEVHAYMVIYGTDGHAPAPLSPPATLGEIVDVCVRAEDGSWAIESRTYTAAYLSAENPSPFLQAAVR